MENGQDDMVGVFCDSISAPIINEAFDRSLDDVLNRKVSIDCQNEPLRNPSETREGENKPS